jgi:hypothetical protein
MLSVFATLLLAASPTTAGTTAEVQPAAGYEELNRNRNEEALRVLDARHDAEDPSQLINLGTTYARLGRPIEARRMFAAAVHSEGRADLLLVDGRVVDSREAAKSALRSLQDYPSVRALASRGH